MTTLEFSPASQADKEYLRALNRSCYEEVVERQLGPWDVDQQNKNFDTKWLEHNFRLINVNGNRVGAIWVDDLPEFRQLREVQIQPDFQNQGIGAAAVRLEIKQARSEGKPLRLRVLFENEAVRLYEKLGFIVIGKNEHQFIMEIC